MARQTWAPSAMTVRVAGQGPLSWRCSFLMRALQPTRLRPSARSWPSSLSTCSPSIRLRLTRLSKPLRPPGQMLLLQPMQLKLDALQPARLRPSAPSWPSSLSTCSPSIRLRLKL